MRGEIVWARDAKERNCAEHTVAMKSHSCGFDHVGAGGPGGGLGAGVCTSSLDDLDPPLTVEPEGEMSSVVELCSSLSPKSGCSKVKVGVGGADISSRTSKLCRDPHTELLLLNPRLSFVGVAEPDSHPDKESIEECL